MSKYQRTTLQPGVDQTEEDEVRVVLSIAFTPPPGFREEMDKLPSSGGSSVIRGAMARHLGISLQELKLIGMVVAGVKIKDEESRDEMIQAVDQAAWETIIEDHTPRQSGIAIPLELSDGLSKALARLTETMEEVLQEETAGNPLDENKGDDDGKSVH